MVGVSKLCQSTEGGGYPDSENHWRKAFRFCQWKFKIFHLHPLPPPGGVGVLLGSGCSFVKLLQFPITINNSQHHKHVFICYEITQSPPKQQNCPFSYIRNRSPQDVFCISLWRVVLYNLLTSILTKDSEGI